MILGVDIGGTKTLVGSFTMDGKLTESIRFETPPLYADFIKEFEVTYKKLKEQKFIAGSVAAPGRIYRDMGIVAAFGNLKWHNVPVGKDISGITRCPIYIENDANLAGLSEAHALPSMPDKVLYITVSTGIGSGVIGRGVIDKTLEDSEPGFMVLPYNGKMQIWESFASGKAIVSQLGKRASEITDPKEWKLVASHIGLGLVELCAVIEPEVIIIGGGVGTHYKKYQEPLLGYLKANLNSYIRLPKIVGAKHAEEAALLGCYELTKQKLDGRA